MHWSLGKSQRPANPVYITDAPPFSEKSLCNGTVSVHSSVCMSVPSTDSQYATGTATRRCFAAARSAGSTYLSISTNELQSTYAYVLLHSCISPQNVIAKKEYKENRTQLNLTIITYAMLLLFVRKLRTMFLTKRIDKNSESCSTTTQGPNLSYC